MALGLEVAVWHDASVPISGMAILFQPTLGKNRLLETHRRTRQISWLSKRMRGEILPCIVPAFMLELSFKLAATVGLAARCA
jgi:hypothetical protein